MKLKNQIMKFLMSPGTYMVWHALGSPQEWLVKEYTMIHQPTSWEMWVGGNGPWFYSEWRTSTRGDCFGLFERHLLQFRVRKVRRYHLQLRGWRKHNHDIFVRMTQLRGKQ
jgi:hypothetical protein